MTRTNPSQELASLLIKIAQRPQEITRSDLYRILGIEDNDYLLAKITKAHDILVKNGIEILPRLQDEPPGDVFLLKIPSPHQLKSHEILNQLSNPESSTQEFKSSYWCDLKRLSHQPKAAKQELKSNKVIFSSLKAIAGFLTTGGGTLFIGVDDSGGVIGLQHDLALFENGEHQNADHLINSIKTDIDTKFLQGPVINDYVIIEPVDIDNEQILRIEIISRKSLSFLNSNGDHQLFRRQDTRTTRVPIYDLEEFQEFRHENIL